MTSKVKRPARPLAQLNRVERHIKKQVQMSKVIDHLYAEHNDQLEFTHKQAREEGYSAARCEGENELS
jgi:Uri superfamily endonuclease